jgi:hypothetical protein
MKNYINKILFKYSIAVIVFLFTITLSPAKERPDPVTGKIPPEIHTLAPINNVFMQANNINTCFRSDGVFNYDKITYAATIAGMIWPASAPQRLSCDFSTGIWIGALVNGQLRTAVSLYNSIFTPGNIPVQGGVPPSSVCNDPKWKSYHVQLTDPNLINGGTVTRTAGGHDFLITFDAWSSWPVDLGAPYVEVNGVPGYQPGPGGDRPGIGNSEAQPDEIVFSVYMDYSNCTNNLHTAEISLPGGTLPMGVEIHQISFAFNSPGLTNMYFTKFVVINKSSNEWDSTYFTIPNDVDLGWAKDDNCGCVDSLALGFTYNADNFDEGFYGAAPPALGCKYLQGPLIFTGNPNDSVVLPYGTIHGYKELGMTGFNVFENINDPCKGDPSTAIQGYNFMKGNDGCGNPDINPITHQPSKYRFNTATYCSGPRTGWYDSLSTDRRMIQGSGPFTMAAGDTQVIVLGLFMEKGSDNIASVCKLIHNSVRVQRIYDANFRAIPLPPPPQVNAVADGDGKVTLYWGNLSESYHTYDFIDRTGYWDFQGYEVYQIQPGTGGDDATQRSLLAVYDIVDSIDINGGANHIMDSIDVTQPNGTTQSEWVPVTYGTNSGLSRIITLTQNRYPSGSNNFFINGQDYKFAVIAYGCNIHAIAGAKVLRNPISAQVITVRPNFPIMGSNFINKNLDTLVSNRVDRSFLPVVVDQKRVLSARYQMVWQTDTSWNVVRIMNSQVDTLGKNSTNISALDNFAFIFDGILFKADTISHTGAYTPDIVGNFGVIKDPGPGNQTSGKGWTYTGGNLNFTGVDTNSFINYPSGNYKPMQSMSMGLSWPAVNNFKFNFTSKIDTTFIKTYGLKRVRFNFGQTQKAYRYRGAVNNSPYQDYVDVPFTCELFDPLDSNMSTPRQLNVAFYDGDSSGTWNPKAKPDGGLEIVYVFYSTYSPTANTFYTTKNINFFTQFRQMDIEYVWWPRLLSSGAAFTNGDVLTIIPYTQLRHYQSPGFVTVAEVSTSAPTIGSNSMAQTRGEMENIRVVPNPYYGGHSQETSSTDRFVTFMRLPKTCNIFIYSLNGNLIKKLGKNDNTTSMKWNLLNTDLIPVASGIYIAYIDAPGIGTKIIKLAVFTPEERLQSF